MSTQAKYGYLKNLLQYSHKVFVLHHSPALISTVDMLVFLLAIFIFVSYESSYLLVYQKECHCSDLNCVHISLICPAEKMRCVPVILFLFC